MRLLDYTDTYQLKENKKDISGFTQDICKRKPFDEVSGKITICKLINDFFSSPSPDLSFGVSCRHISILGKEIYHKESREIISKCMYNSKAS